MANSALSAEAQHAMSAIDALLRATPSEQQAAGRWLNKFAEQPGAAQVDLELLRGDHSVEVQFFAANMLLTAVNRQWTKMEPTLQTGIFLKLRMEVERDRNSPATLSWAAVQRLVLVFGATAAAAGHDHLQDAVKYCLSLASKGSVLMALELLTALAESSSSLHRQQRAKAMPALPPMAMKVFHLVHLALQEQETNGKENAQKLAALKCLRAWLRLDSDEADEALMSAGAFKSTQEDLFAAVMGLLDDRDKSRQGTDPDLSKLAEQVTEIIVHLMGSYACGTDPEKEEAAVQAVGAALIHRQQLGVLCQDMWHNLAQMAASLAIKDTHAIAGNLPEAVPLASMVLGCLRCGHHGAAGEAIEYFDMLNSVPLAQRDPRLGPPIYASMLPHLSCLASYPPDFQSWDSEHDIDSGTFHSFRDNLLSDALDSCQKQVGQHYLEYQAQAIRSATRWQEAEAALFALRMYRRKSGQMQYVDGGGEEDTFLLGLLSHLTSLENAMRKKHPYYLDSLMQMIACNSAWIATSPQGLLEAAIGCTFQGLQAQESMHSAATAFKMVCRDMPQSRSEPLFAALLPVLQPLLQSTGGSVASWKDKIEVVHGLAVLIAAARMKTEPACSSSSRLGLPLLEQAASLATQQWGVDAAAAEEAVAGLLSLVASVLERLEFVVCEGSSDEQHPASFLARACLPHLRTIANSDLTRNRHPVASALCKVLKHCLQALGAAVEVVLAQVVQLLEPVFPGDPEACLEVLTAAVDMSHHCPASLDSLGLTVSQLATVISSQLQGEHVNPDLATAWFKLLSHCLIDDPDNGRQPLVARVAPSIPHHFTLALRCLMRHEEDLVRSAITFIRGSLGLDVVNTANTADTCIQAEGENLVRVILRAVAVTCPPRLVRTLAVLLHSLFNHATYGQPVRATFQACMLNDEVLGKHLDLEDRQKICTLALNMYPTVVGSFGALVKDMASIARNEMNSEVLLSYQL